MELLIVLGVVCVAIAGARWLIVRQEGRERIKRRLDEFVVAQPEEPK